MSSADDLRVRGKWETPAADDLRADGEEDHRVRTVCAPATVASSGRRRSARRREARAAGGETARGGYKNARAADAARAMMQRAVPSWGRLWSDQASGVSAVASTVSVTGVTPPASGASAAGSPASPPSGSTAWRRVTRRTEVRMRSASRISPARRK